MLTQNFIQILPAFIGLLITSSWLIYTSFKVAYNLDLIQIIINWFSNKKIILPSFATLISPFLFMYIYKIVPILVDKWRLREFIGILGAVTGVILGFFVSEFRQWKTEGQQINTVRTMLKYEIKQDLELLTELKKRIENTASQDIFQTFRENSTLTWNRTIWKSQVLLIPLAFTEEEIGQFYQLYNELDDVMKQYSHINDLISKYDPMRYKTIDVFKNEELYNERRDLREEIFSQINKFNETISKILSSEKIKIV